MRHPPPRIDAPALLAYTHWASIKGHLHGSGVGQVGHFVDWGRYGSFAQRTQYDKRVNTAPKPRENQPKIAHETRENGEKQPKYCRSPQQRALSLTCPILLHVIYFQRNTLQ